MILHYLGLDHIGHKTGPQGPNMLPKQREMDGIVKMIYEAMETQDQHQDTLLVLLGDHGMNAAGNHGGSGPGETEPALLFASPKLKSSSNRRPPYDCPTLPKDGTEFHFYDKVEQSDIVPTLAGLMQLPIPKNSLGVVIEQFVEVWTRVESARAFLHQNAQQILRIVEATFGQDHFAATMKARRQRLADPGTMDCKHSEDITDELACWLVRAEEAVDRNSRGTELHTLVNDFDKSDALPNYAFLRLAQQALSSTASSYNIARMTIGMAVSALGIAVCLCSFRSLWPPTMASSALTFASVLYGVMIFASSYVEEEQHFWYWLTPAWITLLSMQSFARARGARARYRVATAAIVMLAVHRTATRWNQTGQKHAGEPDIVHGFFPEHHILMWMLVLVTYCYNGLALVQHTFAGIIPNELAAIAALALVVPAIVFKLNFTQADAPELVRGLALPIIQWTSAFSLVLQAQVTFVLLALVTIVICMLAIMLSRSTVLIGHDAPAVRVTLPERIHYLLTLFLITQSRAPNIPLFLGVELQRRSLGALLRVEGDSSQHRRNALISGVKLATTVLLLSHTYFFCFGGSNSISSIDLANAYNGVGNYSIVAVGILLFSANWTGPIWWCSAAVLLTFSKASKPMVPLKTSEGRSWVHEERERLRKEGPASSHTTGDEAETDIWLMYVSSMTAFVAGSLFAVMAACTVLRTHLFIWTVFSPKYLYAMAWGVGWHLIVNVGLGSVLRGLGQFG